MSVADRGETPGRWLDPKRVNRALLGAWYEEDIHERLCGAVPAPLRARLWPIAPAMRARNLIFVHVPRVAGTSMVRALYETNSIRHHSIRFYRTVAPDFTAAAASFALLRDPLDRFASSYAFVRARGTSCCRLSDVFAAQTAKVQSVDDYLSFLEGRGVLDLDFVMRPQSWFVCDLTSGEPLVKDLFLYREDDAALDSYLAPQGVKALPWLNRAPRQALFLSARQRRRIEHLYADDFALIALVRARRAESGRVPAVPGAENLLHATWIAAE